MKNTVIFCLFLFLYFPLQGQQDRDAKNPYQQKMEAFWYRENNKYGFVDTDGNIKIPAIYDEFENLKYDKWANTYGYLVKKDGKFGLIDFAGKEVFPAVYNSIECKNDSCVLSKDGKRGFATSRGKIFIPFKYDGLDYIKEKMIFASVGGKAGFLDLNGNWAIPPKFDLKTDDLGRFSEGMATLCDKQTNKCGYIDKNGELVIPKEFERYPGDFHYGLAAVTIGGKLAYINKSGKMAFPSEWEVSSESDFKNGAAEVRKNCRSYDDYGVCDDYLINTKGEIIIPEGFLVYRANLKENYSILRSKTGNREMVIDNSGRIIVPDNFKDIILWEKPLNCFRAIGEDENHKPVSVLFDRMGQQITDSKYYVNNILTEKDTENPRHFIEVQDPESRNTGILDENGKEILKPIFSSVELQDGIFRVATGEARNIGESERYKKCGYYNSDGYVMIPEQYFDCTDFNGGLAVVYDDNGYKVIDTKNNTVKRLGNIYDHITKYYNGVASVSKNEKYGFINTKGEEIVPLKYDYTYHYNAIIEVRLAGKVGAINNKGKVIIPLEYEDMPSSTCNGKIYAEKGGKEYWYDLSGRRISDRNSWQQCSKEAY